MNLKRNNYYLSNLKDSNRSNFGKRKGAAGALYAKYRASMDGYVISSEESDAFDFDFTVFNDTKHYGVQAKSAAYCRYNNGNGTSFTICKRNKRRTNGVWRWDVEEYRCVDIFVLVDLRYELIAWIPFEYFKGKKKYNISFKDYQHWTLEKIIGKPSDDVEEGFKNIEDILSQQQELFIEQGEINDENN